jgi:hypothetical protein
MIAMRQHIASMRPEKVYFRTVYSIWGIAMQRIYGSVDDQMIDQIDAILDKSDLSRAQWVAEAIAAHIKMNGTNIDQLRADIDRKDQEIAHLKKIITIRESEIQHLRYLTNDLRSLADNLAAKVPMLTGPTEEKPKTKSWWRFWK